VFASLYPVLASENVSRQNNKGVQLEFKIQFYRAPCT
jgi:hypothetical protein